MKGKEKLLKGIEVPQELNGIVPFYEMAASKAGIEVADEDVFDCRKIEVSKPMWDELLDRYTEYVRKCAGPDVHDGDIRAAAGMRYVSSGPSCDHDLKPGQVRLQAGFVSRG
jgi:hypothetical protein